MADQKSFRIKSKYLDDDAVIDWGIYQDLGIAMTLKGAATGETLCRPTTCLAEYSDIPPPSIIQGEVYIKTYSENLEIFEGLIAAGVITDTGKSFHLPPYSALVRVGKLTEHYLNEVDTYRKVLGVPIY